MDLPKVIAIILNWNLVDDTFRCVLSLNQSDYPNLEALVVDNGSERALYEQLRIILPAGIQLLRSEENLGFAAGNNLGLRFALAHGADYVLVINNDTIVDPTMISQMMDVALAHPEAGLLGPIIYYVSAPDRVWFAGYRFSHGIYILRRGLHLIPPLERVEEVDFVSGCSMLINRAVLETIGLFSSDYFMYYEDLDLCFRTKAAGFKILCVTGAKMWHAVSASTGGSDSPLKQYYQVKSSLIFYRKHSRGLKRLLNVTLRLGHASVTVINAVLHGRLKRAAIRMFLHGICEGWQVRSIVPPTAGIATIPIDCCPICGSIEHQLLFNGSDRLHDLSGEFPVMECIHCQSAYLARRPIDLAAYYPVKSYAAYDRANTQQHFSHGIGRNYGLKRRRRLVEDLKPNGGTLLDVGCGTGDFLELMQSTGHWQVVGLEPNATAAQSARETRQLTVKTGQLPDASLHHQTFDVITLWHVLEHVPEPALVLAEVRRLLKPDGVLVVGVPLRDSSEARWFGANWAGYDVPRHLVTFTRLSLRQLTARCGFYVEEQTGVVQSFSSLRISIGMWLNHKGRVWRRFQRILMPLLLFPLFMALRLRSGSRLSVGVFVGRVTSSRL